MKTKVSILFLFLSTLFLATAAETAPPTSDITFSVDFTGTPNAGDVRGAKHIIALENARRAAQDPPEAVLPDSTGAEVKSSYLAVLAQVIQNAHLDYIRQAATIAQNKVNQDLWRDATDAQRAAALAALVN